jgi:hypothetical protein
MSLDAVGKSDIGDDLRQMICSFGRHQVGRRRPYMIGEFFLFIAFCR